MQQTVDNEEQVKQVRKKPKQQERSTGEDRRMRLRAWMASQDAEEVVPALSDVQVVLLGTKRTVTIGMVARACAAFEVGELTFVQPRANVLQQSAIRASRGALQHTYGNGLRWRECETLEEAVGGKQPLAVDPLPFPSEEEEEAEAETSEEERDVLADMKKLFGAGELSGMFAEMRREAETSGSRLCLVFGREDTGFLPGELQALDADGVCSIPMSSRWDDGDDDDHNGDDDDADDGGDDDDGDDDDHNGGGGDDDDELKGTESLSLAQAVPVVLSRLYEDHCKDHR
ncbi:hypothetical protein GUITHDRAFT_111161 [Guillardia theta CCMP2712]|uniref:tRNA/rRNA methyltransferase SpoU type domain-containing protein n=1 Tax=Guillardia theta (strain CCMP2712) TaxID=905079 RepID=L1J3C9_GUITC|nr:hypothetical protein GUITHDRAFT_111161 [Guillardia theta CCMP2712]EKX42792.1 hypothetical protein GUITHDRAFT_111161 [Guillardia theta CCMP2712]|eukprot:XP_005829772.1 hypothetical protein GUITHDRAFT_111161 [Guillardia theta CCMP2712]